MGGLTGVNKLRNWAEIEWEAQQMELEGYRRWEIAETLGVSVDWLRSRLGVSSKRRPGRPLRERERVEYLHWRGLTLGQIALYTQIPKSTIHEWVTQR